MKKKALKIKIDLYIISLVKSPQAELDTHQNFIAIHLKVSPAFISHVESPYQNQNTILHILMNWPNYSNALQKIFYQKNHYNYIIKISRNQYKSWISVEATTQLILRELKKQKTLRSL